MSQRINRPSRRTFLFAAGTGGVTAAAALVAANVPQTPPPTAATPADKREGSGYAESAHVRNYYRTTRI